MIRIQSADVLRVLGIVAVVGLHTASYTGACAVGRALDLPTLLNNIGRFAVPLFFVLSGYFWAGRCKTGADYIARSVQTSKRIFFIFLAWSCIYLVAPVGDAFDAHGFAGPIKQYYWSLSISGARFLNGLLEGPKVHLWFLPALIISTLTSGIFLAKRMAWPLLTLAIVLFVIGLGGHAYRDTPFGFHSDFNFRDGPFFGLLFFVTGYFLHKIPRTAAWLPAGLALTLAGFALQIIEVTWLHDKWGGGLTQDYVLSTYPFGVGTALIALSDTRFLRVPRLANLGPLVLGVYASHFLFVDLLRPYDNRHCAEPVWQAAYIAIVFALSITTTYAMSRLPVLRRFVA